MKKFIYISGVILINLQLAGVIFKVNHWPGAGILLSLSIILMVFYFFPIALINSYKQHKNKSQLHLYLIAYLTIAFTSLGMLFKIMHWPGASIMLFIGLPLPFVLFLPFYMRYHNKTKAKSDKNFFGVIFFMMYLAIISTLLALNVTKNTIDSIIPLIEESVSQSKILALRNDQLYEDLTSNHKNEAELIFIKTLSTNADNLCEILEEAKIELMLAASKENQAIISGKSINYRDLKGADKKDNTVSFISQEGDGTGENLVQSRLIDFENSIKNLSDSYDLSEILNPKDGSYSLAIIKNIYFGKIISQTLVVNLSSFSFMQNRVRLIEYQILNLLTQQTSKLQN